MSCFIYRMVLNVKKLLKFKYTPPTRDEHPFNIAVGLFRGHQVTKIERKKRGVTAKIRRKRTYHKFVNDLVHEIAGFAPYEKRAMELLKVGRDKRTLKFLKKRVNIVPFGMHLF